MRLLRRSRPAKGELGDRMGMFTSFWLNDVAGSHLLHPRIRRVLLRMGGLKVPRGMRVFPRVRFAGSTDLTFGEGVVINTGALLDACGPIFIGDRSQIGADSHILTAGHDVGPAFNRIGPIKFLTTRIGDGVWVGTGARILPGVTIGDGCMIAAGAVVNKDCGPDGLYGGVPARRIRDLDST